MSECVMSSLLVAQLVQSVVQLEAYLAHEPFERERIALMIQNQQSVYQQSRHDLHHNPIWTVRNQMAQTQSVLQPTEQDLNRPAVKVQQANLFHRQLEMERNATMITADKVIAALDDLIVEREVPVATIVQVDMPIWLSLLQIQQLF